MAQEVSIKITAKTQTANRLRKSDYKHHFYLESFGVKIGVSSNAEDAIEAVKKAVEIYLPGCFTEIEKTATEHSFLFVWNKSGRDTLYKNGERITKRESRETSVETIASRIRLTVAEFAVGRVFVHAGVVAWKNKAIIMPARSFKGKTSLTLALVQRGAVYYSDEFAILDADGFLYPFPKMLSVRGVIDERKQVDIPVENFGGVVGTGKIRAGMVLITEFKPRALWNPKILTPVKGIIEILNNSVAIRQNPQFTLEVLNKIVRQAPVIKSKRGDVGESADMILKFIDSNLKP
jgi:hypothetical protein